MLKYFDTNKVIVVGVVVGVAAPKIVSVEYVLERLIVRLRNSD